MRAEATANAESSRNRIETGRPVEFHILASVNDVKSGNPEEDGGRHVEGFEVQCRAPLPSLRPERSRAKVREAGATGK